MKLTFEQIRSVAFGAVSVREESDRVRFFKCTDRQAEVWNRARADLGERAFATSGVRLDFHTDSERLSFRAVSGRKYDLLINGKIAERVRCTDEEINRVHSFDLPKGEKRVTLVFPSHSVGSIADVELADGICLIACISKCLGHGCDIRHEHMIRVYAVPVGGGAHTCHQ